MLKSHTIKFSCSVLELPFVKGMFFDVQGCAKNMGMILVRDFFLLESQVILIILPTKNVKNNYFSFFLFFPMLEISSKYHRLCAECK